MRRLKALSGGIVHLRALDGHATLTPGQRGHRSETEPDRPEMLHLRDALILHEKCGIE